MIAFGGAIWEVLKSDSTYASTMRFSTLLAIAAIGEWIAERAGTINISVEGMILTGAFTAALGSDLTGNVWVGLLFGVLGGFLVAYVQGTLSHRFNTNQFVVGLTLNPERTSQTGGSSCPTSASWMYQCSQPWFSVRKISSPDGSNTRRSNLSR